LGNNLSAMKYLYFLTFIVFFFAPNFLYAQNGKDYTIYLQAGKLLPAENITTVSTNDPVFENNKFIDKYYVVVQFYQIPDETLRNELLNAGIRLIDYLPNYAFTAAVAGNVNLDVLRFKGIRSIIALNAFQKSSQEINQRKIPAHAIKQPGMVDLTIITHERANVAALNTIISGFNAFVLNSSEAFRTYDLRIPQSSYYLIANHPLIQWIEFAAPENVEENLLGRTLHRVNILQDGVRNLKGEGINIGIWDGGPVFQHMDFGPTGRLTIMETGAASDHGTHCAGTIAGAGIINPSAKGMAPKANLFSWNFNGNVQTEMQTGIPNNNLALSSHSYGFQFSGACGLTNTTQLGYSATARGTDLNCNNFPTHLHVHSAGNAGNSCIGGYYTITGSGKSAKNNLVVANITTNETRSSSSSAGPVQDGRIKPEIAAMGSNVLSTISNNQYDTYSGTSMSTPGVAGAAGLIYQRYKQLNSNNNPPSALVKNFICNTARELGNPGPDFQFGYGRIDALSAVEMMEDNRYVANTVANANANEFNITVPANTIRLKVMITWNDPAAASNAATALVNNLDLIVFKGTDSTFAWKLDKDNPSAFAFKGRDSISNIEQVVVDNPTGTYTIRTEGITVPSGPQQYFITWVFETASIKVLYPNGNEKIWPGNFETITWNNSGINSPQTIEYSLDNGSNWTVLSTSVPAQTTRYFWNTPSNVLTSTALVRITSGAITDVSDANFTIMRSASPVSANGTCTPGQLLIEWGAAPGATSYDVLRLNETTGEWSTIVADVTGTSHLLNGLQPLTAGWYAILSKSSTTNSVSDRSFGVRGVTSLAGANMGTISGSNSLCVGTNSVVYSIPALAGAISYNWTVPQGAQIASGGGTTTITVNYSNTAVSGNVSVTGIDLAGCSTLTSQRAVTVNSLPAQPTIIINGNLLSTAPGLAEYRWFLNNVLITGATANTYNATASGVYRVEVTNSSGCSNSSESFNFILTSLNEVVIEGSKITVFPNPVKDFINFRVNQQNFKRIEASLLTVDGKIIQQTVLPNGISQMNISNLANGSYIVRIKSGNEMKSIKVTVIH
jgi:subtilisin family serine protease